MTIKQIDKELNELSNRMRQNRQQAGEVHAKFSIDRDAYHLTEIEHRAAVIAGASSQLPVLDRQLASLDKILSRDQILIEELNAVHQRMEADKIRLGAERQSAFIEAARPVIRKLRSRYDAQALGVLTAARDLLAIHQVLRGVGAGQTYAEEMGPGHVAIPGLRVPVMEGFSLERLNSKTTLHPGRGVLDEITNLILKHAN